MKSKIIIISSAILTILGITIFSLISKPGEDYLVYKDSLRFFKGIKYYLAKNEYITQDEKFCNAFCNDFKKEKNIEVIEPVVVTYDINDPKFKKYTGESLDSNQHCEVYHCTLKDLLTKHKDYSPPLKKFLYWNNLSIMHLYANEYTAQKFKLYDIDFNNTLEDGKHSFFISQNYTMSKPHNNLDEIKDTLPARIYEVAVRDYITHYEKYKYDSDNYFIVDFNIPKIHYSSNIVNYKSTDLGYSYDYHLGIIKYKKKIYMYDINHRYFELTELPPKPEWQSSFRVERKCIFWPKKL